MRIDGLLARLRDCPLVASVQAAHGSPLEDPEILLALARASLAEGVRVIRLQGRAAIERIQGALAVPVIGLVKRDYKGSPVYITPTLAEVEELLATGCEAISLDATRRPRPGGARFEDLAARIHAAGRLVVADCDSPASIRFAVESGADVLATTLSGYTEESPFQPGPDLDLVREAVRTGLPTLAEGRYSQDWHVRSARAIGAHGIVIGAALNDPHKLTRAFVEAAGAPPGPVAAVDLGGTWLRYGFFDVEGALSRQEKIATPADPAARLAWIRDRVAEDGATRLGIASGGTVDPRTGYVSEAKDLIPGHAGTSFGSLADPVSLPTVVALNDGLATAWGHACHPAFAGRRVATLALGTGVGFGLVDQGRIWMGARGEYPRINDVAIAYGITIEDLLGGAALAKGADRDEAHRAAERAVELIRELYYPDEIVLCGGVGMSDWLELGLPRSPFGADAGLFGAAALARFRPF